MNVHRMKEWMSLIFYQSSIIIWILKMFIDDRVSFNYIKNTITNII